MSPVAGIDVSRWQEEIDWQAVRASGVRFAFIKATEGIGYVDPYFARNWQGAKEAGILRGAYHFFRPLQDAKAQAQHLVSTVDQQANDLPFALDLEAPDGVGNAAIIQRTETFLKEVEKLSGQKPIIYSSPAFCSEHFTQSPGKPPAWARNYIFWIANYTQASQPFMPSGWNKWTIWQYSSTGSVNGIGGNVDLDWFNGSLQDLAQLVGLDSLPEDQTEEEEVVIINEGTSDSGDTSEGEDQPEDQPVVRTYVVKSGDNLTIIAKRFQTTVDALVAANKITNPDLIFVGQEIVIA